MRFGLSNTSFSLSRVFAPWKDRAWPQRKAVAQLPHLPNELILEILEHLTKPLLRNADGDEAVSDEEEDKIRKTLAACSLVSPWIRRTVLSALFHTVTLHYGCQELKATPDVDFDEEPEQCTCHSIEEFSAFLETHQELMAYVQEVRICGSGCEDLDTDGTPALPQIKITALADVLVKIPNLRVLRLTDVAFVPERRLHRLHESLHPLDLDRVTIKNGKFCTRTPAEQLAPLFCMLGEVEVFEVCGMRFQSTPLEMPLEHLDFTPTRLVLRDMSSISFINQMMSPDSFNLVNVFDISHLELEFSQEINGSNVIGIWDLLVRTGVDLISLHMSFSAFRAGIGEYTWLCS